MLTPNTAKKLLAILQHSPILDLVKIKGKALWVTKGVGKEKKKWKKGR